MRICFTILFATLSFGHVLSVDVPAPEYQIIDNTLVTENTAFLNAPGAPNVPCRKVTIALPPGALVESVSFSGTRQLLGSIHIPATQPMLPLVDGESVTQLYRMYEKQKDIYYSTAEIYPQSFGTAFSQGGLRKYTLIDVACNHFAYKPSSQELFFTPRITVTIHYSMPVPDSERARFWRNLADDITYDGIAKEIIYNWQDAMQWYRTDTPKRAHGYYIIIPASLTSAVDTLVAYYQDRGYDVNIVTKEYIEANASGVDLPQKIRNYLRENLADIEYLLLVGFSTDVPWRSMVPFNNDPDSPYNGPDYSPIPSDLYYAELTDHDTLSWNSDRDSYYGEVYDQYFNPVGEDNPDYHADIHLGRIPFSSQSTIEHICEKLIQFDTNTDMTYKTASLLAGAVYYYANEDYTGRDRNDGADYTEELLNDGILDQSNAVTLYEKGGLAPCSYTCTDSLTHTNMIGYWQQKGIMYECHHGNNIGYARKIWAWDNGNGVPEAFEMQWPFTLTTSDVYQLDDDYPATSVLRSCLCGNPDVVGLGSQLLNHGSSAVISSSRISWMTSADPGGIPYHFFDRLLQDTSVSHGIIGDAYDLSRTDFMHASMFWLPAYHYNLFGDPALKQLGRPTGIQEIEEQTEISTFAVFPNPTQGPVTIRMHAPQKRILKLNLYDESGRFVQSLYHGQMENGTANVSLQLPAGVYFLELKDDIHTEFRKLVVIE